MKYNIFTVANKSYAPFLDIFINSVLDKCKNVNSIFVGDAGLENYRNYFLKKEKVIILDSFCDDNFFGIHSNGWAEATQQKTILLLRLLKNHDFNIPLVMIDSDVCLLNDIETLIDKNCDIQITKRPEILNAAGILLKEIASFMIFNNMNESKKFVHLWIEKMKLLSEENVILPHETPALNLLVKEKTLNLKIGHFEEKKVCSPNKIYKDTYSIHFKSNGKTSDSRIFNFESRLNNKNIDNLSGVDIDVGKYLGDEFYRQWKHQINLEDKQRTFK